MYVCMCVRLYACTHARMCTCACVRIIRVMLVLWFMCMPCMLRMSSEYCMLVCAMYQVCCLHVCFGYAGNVC